jgi:hypothetical protein
MARFTFVIALIHLSVSLLAQTEISPSSSLPVSASGLPMLVEGTVVKLRTTSPLSSSDARVGESVEFEVSEEVRVGNIIVIPKTGAAYATVTAAQSKRSSAKTGKLEVRIDYVRLANGDKAALRPFVSAATSSSMSDASSKVVLNPLSTAGKDVTIARGTEISACIDTSIPIDPRKFGQVGGAVIAVPESVKSEGITEVAISSNPAGAEIAVDEKLAGLTPLRVIVRRGDHVIALRLAGYSPWVSSVHAAGGKMTVTASLDKGNNAEILYDSANPLATCAVAKGCPESPLAAAGRAARARHAQQQNPSSHDSDPQQ